MTKGAWDTRLGSYYGITSKFIEKYYEGKNNAIIYLGACQSGKDNVLANAFLSKGASAVYCYDETVSMEYEMIMRTLVFYGLTTKYHHGTEPYTTADALAYAQSICGTNDPFIEESTRAKLMLVKENDVAINEKGDISTDNNEGTMEYEGPKYEFYNNSMTWEEAKAFCEEQGGHLVTINSVEEQYFLQENCTGEKNLYWIGLQEINNEWMWIAGEELLYTNWAIGEPNADFNDTEYYAQMYGKDYDGYQLGEWNDSRNDSGTMAFYQLENVGFICEWDTENILEFGGHKYKLYNDNSMSFVNMLNNLIFIRMFGLEYLIQKSKGIGHTG